MEREQREDGRKPLEEAVSTPKRCGRPRSIAIAAVSLALLAFGLNLAIAIRLGSLAVVDQYDVLFEADPSALLECVVSTECGARSSFPHPNLAVFLNPPVQLAARILKATLLAETSEARIRRGIALVVSPLASALKAPSVFVLFLLLGLKVRQAALLALLSIFSFSQLVFGSIPESFALSGLLLAAAYLLSVHAMNTGDRRIWPWMLIGILAAGVTLANLAFVTLLFVAARLHNRETIGQVGLSTALLIAVVLVPTFALPTLFRDSFRLREISVRGGADYTTRWMTTEGVVDRALSTPAVWSHTFAAPAPGTEENWIAIREGSRYPFRFTLSATGLRSYQDLLTLCLLALLVAGAAFHQRAPRTVRWTCAVSFLIIGVNGALHSVWVAEIFLYSQHWQLSLLILLAGPLFSGDPRVRRAGTLVLSALVVAMVFQNGVTANAMSSKLETTVAPRTQDVGRRTPGAQLPTLQTSRRPT